MFNFGVEPYFQFSNSHGDCLKLLLQSIDSHGRVSVAV